jgi:peroxiredoxin
MTTVVVNQPAPDIALSDARGWRFSLSEALKNGPVVAAFFKLTCPTSQYTFPFLERLYQAYKDTPVTFVGISQDDARDTDEFRADCGVTFPLVLDEEGYPVSNRYGLTMMPTLFLIAPDGRVLVSVMGFDRGALERIGEELARRAGRVAAPLFGPDEAVPDYKPG